MYGEELSRQLALDYCCSPADVADSKNHFSIYAPQEGRRRFQEALIRGLKIAVVNGKLLFTGSEEVAEMFKEFDRKEAAYRLRTYRHIAYYSLDRDDGLEHEEKK